ncbi:phosphoribosyltransferase family protein [Acidisoma sp. C75]
MSLQPSDYGITIGGVETRLPIVALNDSLAIALLMVIDEGVAFTARAGAALAEIARPLAPDIVVGAATLGIPVAIEVSRALGRDRYVILQKSPKIHLADALRESVTSVTSHGVQSLLLDRRAVPLLAGRRVFVVDDVVSTGSSLAAMLRLLRRAGAEIAGIGVVLTEGHAWRQALGADAGRLTGLAHIPLFRIENDRAIPDPATL